MKLAIALFTLILALGAGAQTLSLPPASSTAASGQQLSWSAPVANPPFVACDTSFACTYNLYAIAGACPKTLPGSAGWKLVNTTPLVALELNDTTETPGALVSWVVEAVGPNGSNGNPSNCVTATVPASPLVPSPPVLSGK